MEETVIPKMDLFYILWWEYFFCKWINAEIIRSTSVIWQQMVDTEEQFFLLSHYLNQRLKIIYVIFLFRFFFEFEFKKKSYKNVYSHSIRPLTALYIGGKEIAKCSIFQMLQTQTFSVVVIVFFSRLNGIKAT